jgi:hypothetical protein
VLTEFFCLLLQYRNRLSACFILTLILCSAQSVAANPQTNRLTVVGNKVVTNTGKPYIPEGISVYGGLEARRYDSNTGNNYAQIQAAAQYWHSNTIRLQVAESNLFTHLKKGQDYNPRFMNALVNQVNYAHSFGMAVVINDQTEFTSNTLSPTTKTAQFWNVVAQQFETEPYVIFDLFNEPRLTSEADVNRLAENVQYSPEVDAHLLSYHKPAVPMTSGEAWRVWRDGGNVNGKAYLGMQALVNQIRSKGISNLIWVEGTYGARKLPPQQYLLSGDNLVYTIHHPNLNNPYSWQSIGTLAATHPVVEGEWAQYQSSWAECFSRAYVNAPKYLSYLQNHNIGIIAWSLQPNSLLKNDGDGGQPNNLNSPDDTNNAAELSTPDRLTPTYKCGTGYGQGVGRLLQNYFTKNSVDYSF